MERRCGRWSARAQAAGRTPAARKTERCDGVDQPRRAGCPAPSSGASSPTAAWWRRRRPRKPCRRRRAPAVDMETHVAARVSRAARPALRGGAGHLGCGRPDAAAGGAGGDGAGRRRRIGAVLLALASRPGQLPALIGAAMRRPTARCGRLSRAATCVAGTGSFARDLGQLALDVGREHVLGRARLARSMSGAIGPSVRTPLRPTLIILSGWRIAVGRGRALEAAMDHAVRALLVLADAVLVPVGAFHQLLEGLHIAFAEQVAGLLPAEDGAQRHRPGRAFIGLVAGEEVEEQRRLGERSTPCRRRRARRRRGRTSWCARGSGSAPGPARARRHSPARW